jgi:hypothetical protein
MFFREGVHTLARTFRGRQLPAEGSSGVPTPKKIPFTVRPAFEIRTASRCDDRRVATWCHHGGCVALPQVAAQHYHCGRTALPLWLHGAATRLKTKAESERITFASLTLPPVASAELRLPAVGTGRYGGDPRPQEPGQDGVPRRLVPWLLFGAGPRFHGSCLLGVWYRSGPLASTQNEQSPSSWRSTSSSSSATAAGH